jgi:hypothetical protein
MNLADEFKQAEQQALAQGIAQAGGDWFKFQEGDNIIRVLEKPEMFFEKFKVGICYTDCGYQGTPRFMTRILDRKDGKIKMARLPYIIGTTIAQYQQDPDYAFEVFPMPYDIKIHAKDAGTKEVVYTMTPRPVREAIEDNVILEVQKQTPVPDVIATMKEKQKQKHIEDGTWDANQRAKAKLSAETQVLRDREIEARKGSSGPIRKSSQQYLESEREAMHSDYPEMTEENNASGLD